MAENKTTTPSTNVVTSLWNTLAQKNWAAGFLIVLQFLGAIFQTLIQGYQTRTLPWVKCLLCSQVTTVFLLLYGDLYLLKLVGFQWLWPRSYAFTRYPYVFLGLTSGFWLWAMWQTMAYRRLRTRMNDSMTNIGLKNGLGKTPEFVFDQPMDQEARKLRLKRNGIPLSQFQQSKDVIGSELNAYIEEIRENRVQGTVDVIYAFAPVPKDVPFPSMDTVGPWSFLVGKTRSQEVVANLRETPHQLIAGETGGGKSTFLRGVITTLYLCNQRAHFHLIDLKGGMEFQIFEKLPRVTVLDEIYETSATIKRLSNDLDYRMSLLKEAKCQNIDQYWKEQPGSHVSLPRQVVVIDEAAEAFLMHPGVESKLIHENRAGVSRIARLGRSVGVHLVIATQRPDSKALDSQTKANLTGVVCFPMVNDSSSISVLGVGRASDLPAVPGRAIWKSGMDIIEIQTPHLSRDQANLLLASHRSNKPVSNVQNHQTPSDTNRKGVLYEQQKEESL